ncbi:MAG: O-acetyl-ADP-ribose deacetylase [Spirochaetia bacterium]
MKSLFDGRIEVHQGDITKCDVDALVNAANSSLMGGGGVDGAIHRAGGPSILEECKKLRNTEYPDGLPAGEAAVTGSGNLNARAVIHTVGPVWHGGSRHEDSLLENAYRNSLEAASREGFRTVAFPAISTGVYSFPKERAALIAWNIITAFLETHDIPEKVLLVFYSQSDYDLFLESLEGKS